MFEQNKPRLAELAKSFLNSVLVSRYRSSHHCAAHSFANFGIKGTLATYDSSAGFGFEVPTQTRGYNDRNFKSTALAPLRAARWFKAGDADDGAWRDLEHVFRA